jgi:DNA-binding NtrC family response regulator
MTPSPAPYRRVLIIEDDACIRNVLYVLLANLGCEGEIAHSSADALAMLRRESFDAVLLDLRCAYAPPEEMVSKIRSLRPSLVGRVLIITGEAEDVEAIQRLERHCLQHVSRCCLSEGIGDRLREFLNISKPVLRDRTP